MRLYNGSKELQIKRYRSEYPIGGILLVSLLLYTAMLVSWYLVYPAFLLCIYRIIRYDARTFSVDYCVLLPLSTLLQTSGGMSLLIFVCLFAALWYAFKGGIYVNGALLMLLLLLNYLFLRMQMEVSKMVLFFGQLFLLYILLPKQDANSAERASKAFCISLFISSVYALIFRKTSAMYALRGNEVPAYWGSTMMRFQGLFEDPNYYMLLLITAVALLLKLRDSNRIKRKSLLLMGSSLVLFGLLTYSKTFFLVFVLLIGIYVLWQFRNKKYFFGTVLGVVLTGTALILLFADFSPISIIVTRLFNSSSISDFTTGRSDIFGRYWDAITQNGMTFLFGHGFAAQRLGRDTHNLYLEIMYYSGAVGLLLVAGFYGAMVHMAQGKTKTHHRQNLFAKYEVLIIVLTVFLSLHGVFSVLMYGVFYLAFLSVLLIKKTEVK